MKTLEKVEIPPAAAPAEFPPPIFAAAASVFVFRCFYGALLKETLGDIYIGVFRSNEVGWLKIEANQTVDDENRAGATPPDGRATCALLGLQPFQLRYRCSSCFL